MIAKGMRTTICNLTVATDPIFRNRPGKIRFKVGRRLSLFDLTEPSSPERVGDMVKLLHTMLLWILLRLCLMLLQNLQNVTVTIVNLVTIQLAGGKFSKILWMI